MTQGDEFFWGSNCDSGATINWEIWYDVNSNSSIDRTTDILLTSENITDGNPLTEADPILDGYSITEVFYLSGEPGTYLFKATDIEADSSLEKTATLLAMSSPPNQLTGQISLPGVSAPNSLLANVLIFAESETGSEGAFLAVTNSMGMYSMNVGAIGTGVQFYLSSSNVSGFVAPDYISAIASGVVGNNDFAYAAATDSVWGYVKDEMDVVIPWETDVRGESSYISRNATTLNGRYVLYFSGSDNGMWSIQPNSRTSPILLSPEQFTFDLDEVSNFQHDITLIRADTLIYARITENGGLPANRYRVDAYSYSLGSSAEAVSGIGTDNLTPLHVSSLDPSDWQVWINQWDDEFPIPYGLAVRTDAFGVAPGDTITLELVSGKMVSGTITQDPEDAPINWDNVYVAIGSGGGNPDGGGTYSLFADVGDYYMGVYADGYLANPDTRFVELTDDVSGLDFTINEAHCQVSGAVVNVPLPLDNEFYTVVAQTGSDNMDGYYVIAHIDAATGTYAMNLCDGNWTIIAPWIGFELTPPDPTVVSIGEAPEVSRTLDLEYSGECCTGRVGDANGSGQDEPTIGDISVMIEAKFITLSCDGLIDCFAEGDVNQSGGADATCDDITIGDISILIDYLFISLPQGYGPLPDCL